jgi:inositol-phosphate phosphatase / L-galactose 1-phosphate phosphatase / histidinol-phosphatase
MIFARFPSHTVVGEEDGRTISQGINWIIDPIDGTKSLVCRIPLFGDAGRGVGWPSASLRND